MADFVAVIRRAVDGLTDNSPDMRGKVYDKARGAVRRQLEAMNPRPSDELVQRQLDKLEKAITDVESEHAEALPAEEVLIEETVPAAIEAPEMPVPPETAEQPPEPMIEPGPPEHQMIAEAPAVPQAQSEEAEPPVTDPAPAFQPTEPEPEAQHWAEETASLPQDVVPAQDETAHPDAAVEAEDQGPSFIGLQPVEDPANDHTAFTEQAAVSHPGEPVHDEPAAAAPEAAGFAAPEAAGGTPAAMPWEWSDEPADAEPDEVTAHEVIAREEHAQDFASTEVPAEPPTEWSWPEEATTGDLKTEQTNAKDNAWGDLEDLIGYQPGGKNAGASAATAPDAPGPAGITEAVRNGQRPFRAEPRKRKINFAAIGAAVAALAVVGGAGAAYWLNRGSVDQMISDLVAPAPTPSGETGVADGGSGATATGDQSQSETAGTQVASVETGKSKFTQRLLADGTEIDEGPAVVAGEITTEEGKSVSEQSTEVASAGGASGAATASDGAPDAGTSAGAAPATDTSGQVAAGTPGAATAPGTTQNATTAGAAAQQPSVGVSQKMFLYEERLGQSAPTAIDGTVIWSKGEESPGGDAKPEPVIRAQVNVQSNGLTAQLTLRRNADKSLPASHLVEIVFSLPAEFDGGSIDSVQRVAMKQTEQDRGDPLIAVPAKITEDFHMIALNDFPDAITRNTELLKSRDWIDIPITYRNGRRALITLEKGTTGAEVFNSVMNAWSALGPTANSQ